MAKVKQTELDGEGNVVEKAVKVKAVKVPKVKVAKEKTVSRTLMTAIGEPAEGVKLAPQAAQIVNHIKSFGPSGCTNAQLEAAITADPSFQTRQPVLRVVAYYLPALVDHGITKVEKFKETVPAEQPVVSEETAL